jgi:methionyl-tRNA synthetase
MSLYVTTAIPYVNGAPHLGHALELVQADVLARHRRSRGEPVRFLTGTDDNALKNVAAAAAAGVPTDRFVAANAERFRGLVPVLELSVDDFIATASDPRHAAGVARLWELTAANGDFYRHAYTGSYCTGCEQFYEPAELVGGCCPEHGTAPETVRETNWFFRLSAYAGRIERALTDGTVRVEPVSRRNEVLAFVRAGLRDISVSRPASRAPGWGIPVPGDPDQVVYVWWDALANYVTALGVGTGGAELARWWRDPTERIHVIGKGIVRFHAVYWLALLLSAGLPLPTTIAVHEYLSAGGSKLAKSGGVSVDPYDLVERYGVDAVRWWLLRQPGRSGDTDFTEQSLCERYRRDLAGGVGNLFSRTVTLARRDGVDAAGEPLQAALDLPGQVDRALGDLDFRAAAAALSTVVTDANRHVEATRPWEPGDPAALPTLLATCGVLARELAPFLPSAATRLGALLAAGPAGQGRPGPAFAPLA